MRILIVKMTSMGDIVHAQPLATDLRRAFPDARIEWVVEKPFAPICSLNPAVDRVIPISWRRWRKKLLSRAVRAEMLAFHQELGSAPYDLAIDCQGLLKSAAVTRLAPAALRVGPAWAFAREPLDDIEDALLQGMLGVEVVIERPTVLDARVEHRRVLARAVHVDPVARRT